MMLIDNLPREALKYYYIVVIRTATSITFHSAWNDYATAKKVASSIPAALSSNFISYQYRNVTISY